MSCELCDGEGGTLVARVGGWRVVRVADADFPVFYRVICERHVAEFSDLASAERTHCMDLVVVVEATVRRLLAPTKVNLASLGNVVPHLHWHVIARLDWDSHFPQPIWGARQRAVEPTPEQRLALPLQAVDAAVADALQERMSAS